MSPTTAPTCTSRAPTTSAGQRPAQHPRSALTANDFEVVQLGWNPQPRRPRSSLWEPGHWHHPPAAPPCTSGLFFQNGATVTFGGVAASGAASIARRGLLAVPGPHAAGAVDITVRNPDNRTGTLAGASPTAPSRGRRPSLPRRSSFAVNATGSWPASHRIPVASHWSVVGGTITRGPGDDPGHLRCRDPGDDDAPCVDRHLRRLPSAGGLRKAQVDFTRCPRVPRLPQLREHLARNGVTADAAGATTAPTLR